MFLLYFFFSSRRRHTRCLSDWSSDVCSSDLLPSPGAPAGLCDEGAGRGAVAAVAETAGGRNARGCGRTSRRSGRRARHPRSEEHTSELQSLRHLVCRLLLEKKNKVYIQTKYQ